MSATRPLQSICVRPAEEAKPASTALVPLVTSTQWAQPAPRFPAPDPTFVTQLIANAELLSRRGACSRESAADALSAYHAPHAYRAGLKTRQMI